MAYIGNKLHPLLLLDSVRLIGISLIRSATMAQLAATGIMTILRAIIRRGISSRPYAVKLSEHFELDWLARAILKQSPGFLEGEKFELPPSFSVIAGGDPVTSQEKPERATSLVKTRKHLGRLSKWKSPVSGPAVAAASAIEMVMNTLFTNGRENGNNAMDPFTWDMDVRFHNPKAARKDNQHTKTNAPRKIAQDEISLRVNVSHEEHDMPQEGIALPECSPPAEVTTPNRRPCEKIRLSVKKANGSKSWVADATEIEALLSLWLQQAADFESEQNKLHKSSTNTDKDWLRQKEQKKNLRFLGPDTVALRRDLQWWVPDGALGLLKIQKEKEKNVNSSSIDLNNHVIDYHRITGFYAPKHLKDLFSAPEKPLVEVSFECTPITPDSLEYVPKDTPHKNQSSYRSSQDKSLSDQALSPQRPQSLILSKAPWETDAYAGPTALGMITGIDREVLFAQHIFTAFMSAVASKMDRIQGKSEAFQGAMTNRPTSWQHFRLQNTIVSRLALSVKNTSLGSLEKAFFCIIPPLSMAHRLPLGVAVDSVLRSMAEDENILNWKRSVDVYSELLRFSHEFHSPSCLFTVRAAAASIEYLNRMSNAEELYAEKPSNTDLELLRKTKDTLLEALNNPVSDNVNMLLRVLYKRQNRAKEYQWFMGEMTESPELPKDPQKLRASETVVPGSSSTNSYPQSPASPPADPLSTGDGYAMILGYSPLHNYVVSGLRVPPDPRWCEYVTESDIVGWTPLHYAVMHTTNNNSCNYIE